ncbi:MAG TPA: hypothetical protein VF421_09695 [Niabella sp.]
MAKIIWSIINSYKACKRANYNASTTTPTATSTPIVTAFYFL